MMPKEESLIIDRVDGFLRRIKKNFLSNRLPFKAEFSWSKEAVPFRQRSEGSFREIHVGDSWGQAWDSAWFRLRVDIPAEWAGQMIVAELDFSGEGLVRDVNGRALQGITNGSIFDPNFARTIVDLQSLASPGSSLELWVEAAANSLFGVYLDSDPEPKAPDRFGHFDAKVIVMDVALFDEALWQLYLDTRVLHGLVLRLPEQSVRRARVLRALNQAINVYAKSPEDPTQSRAMLEVEMKKQACASDLKVSAVGHAHIDTAWLWPVKESVRKCMRTFATQLALIDRYPDYVFGASQPQHYAFVKEHDPELYDRIRVAVAKGQWELQGGMWVEADCNLISGESMVRQILHGKNFFMDEFGVDVKNLWLPDVFGYSAALPQILLRSGITSFLTQKLSWSQFNDFPHHTFHWRGLDGSEILTHFPPENTYNSELDTEFLCPAQENFKEKEFLDEFISLFGVGDGGGGPKPESIELGRRLADIEGAPRVHFEAARHFFDRLHKCKDQLPTWVGELYLELHRGTFTTQAHVKKGNRQIENTLRSVEFLFSCLPLENYPQAQLDRLWKTTLLNQFHDILPGSSIHKVYEQTRVDVANTLEECVGLLEKASKGAFEEDQDAFTLLNTLHAPFHGVVSLPSEWGDGLLLNEAGTPQELQADSSGTLAYLSVPAYGTASFRRAVKKIESSSYSSTTSTPSTISGSTQVVAKAVEAGSRCILENAHARYEFNARGQMIRAFDKVVNREIMKNGDLGNCLSLYEDRPNNWDAWDIDIFYLGAEIEQAVTNKPVQCRSGALRGEIKFSLKIGNSTIEQRVRLAASSKRLDFETLVNWNEKHKMLRVAFPVAVQSDEASFDIQYGFVKRPTHQNTSWDRAKFEVVAHRFADLSDDDYGVALLNDGKYGHRLQDNVLDLNLLRSPTNPDPEADEGEHHFCYSLLPHVGTLLESEVQREAEFLNRPPLFFNHCISTEFVIPVHLEGEGLSLEVLKKAEKQNALILRVIETRGRASRGCLTFPGGAEIVEVDLMEWKEQGPSFTGTELPLELSKFEIRTYMLKR